MSKEVTNLKPESIELVWERLSNPNSPVRDSVVAPNYSLGGGAIGSTAALGLTVLFSPLIVAVASAVLAGAAFAAVGSYMSGVDNNKKEIVAKEICQMYREKKKDQKEFYEIDIEAANDWLQENLGDVLATINGPTSGKEK